MMYKRCPTLKVYDTLCKTDISLAVSEGVYLETLIEHLMKEFSLDSKEEAYTYIEREKFNYTFKKIKGKTVMTLDYWPRIDINRYRYNSDTSNEYRCEGKTIHGFRCSTNVNYNKNKKYANCTREQILCWQHCQCEGCIPSKAPIEIRSEELEEEVQLHKENKAMIPLIDEMAQVLYKAWEALSNMEEN